MEEFEKLRKKVWEEKIFSFTVFNENHYIDLIKKNYQNFEDCIQSENLSSKSQRELRWFLDAAFSLNRYFAKHKFLVTIDDLQALKVVISKLEGNYTVYCSYPYHRTNEAESCIKIFTQLQNLSKTEFISFRKKNMDKQGFPLDALNMYKRSKLSLAEYNQTDKYSCIEFVFYPKNINTLGD